MIIWAIFVLFLLTKDVMLVMNITFINIHTFSMAPYNKILIVW
jgi:hypothetical protein